MNGRAKQYIARREDFQKALTDQGQCRVIAVHEDGTLTYTNLAGYITKAILLGSCNWDITLDTHRNGASLKLVLI